MLEDQNLNATLEKYKDDICWDGISRDQFLAALGRAAVLVASMVGSHSLMHEQIVEIAKSHCLSDLIWLPQAGDRHETTVLLYAGMKVIANKLEALNRAV